MNRFSILLQCLLVVVVVSVASQAAYWTEKAQNPAWFPYEQGLSNKWLMDLEIPTATPGFMVSPTDPLAGVQGYWPVYYSFAVFANNKYYVGCGQGPNVALGAPAGYAWPSNSFGEGYTYNRQSSMAIYDPESDTWDCAKWDKTGPVPFNYNTGTGGTVWARANDGTYIGSAQAFAFDVDSDGTEEIYMHGGYPQWDGWNFIYDPDLNGGKGAWTNTAPAAAFPHGGQKCQYNGGCVRVGSNVYVIGGGFWGPDNQCNLQVYNPAADSWTPYENVYPTGIWMFGIGAVNSKIYLLGGREVKGDTVRYSKNVYMLDTENIAAGLKKVGSLVVGVEMPSVIAWRGLLYVVAGLAQTGATNLFQIFNPATGGTTINETPFPVNAYGASCAVSTNGTLYVGGAMRYLETDGTNYNTSRLWIGPLPQQDILVSPTTLDFGQTNNNLSLRLDNVTGLSVLCSNLASVGWLTPNPDAVTVLPASNAFVDCTVNRSMFTGPTNATIKVVYPNGSVTINILADTPRPVAALNPTSTITLQPRTKSFTLSNTGAVDMHYTNTSAEAFITDITPAIGVLAPGASTSISFTVAASAPRPSEGTITIAYNSYDGAPATFTVNNYPDNYYVSTTGDDANDGVSWATAWRNIAHAITNTSNGSAEEGVITINVGPGTFAGECTDTTGTNWLLDLSNRRYVHLRGAGAEQTILTRGGKNWIISFGRDTQPDYPVIKLFNCTDVRVSGFTVIANDPPAYTDGAGAGSTAPDMLAVVGINGGQGVRVDHMYLNGLYTGMVYNAALSNWVASWESWWYFGICVNGVIGPRGAQIDHVLTRGFRHGVMNNSYPYRDNPSNIYLVTIDHCTFVEGVCVSENVAAVTVKVGDDNNAWFSPGFLVRSCIISEYPWSEFPGAEGNCWGLASSKDATAGGELGLYAKSNQFWSCGLPVPGEAWWSPLVIYDDDIDNAPFDNFTNEPPQFVSSPLPYSTDISTPYGDRDVGWSVVPEPAVLLGAILALAALRRR